MSFAEPAHPWAMLTTDRCLLSFTVNCQLRGGVDEVVATGPFRL